MMSNSIMAIKRIAAACTLLGAALAWLVVPMPAAADGLPSLSHGTDSASADCPAPACLRVQAVRIEIKAHDTVPLARFVCPSGHPWLLNVNLSPGRIVPKGIQVLENGGVGVTIAPLTTDPARFVTGYAAGSATNWPPFRQELLVYAYCTNNRDHAYRDIPGG
jgi:hypothetical protein